MLMIEFSEYYSFAEALYDLMFCPRLRTISSYRQSWNPRTATFRPRAPQLLDILGVDSDPILPVGLHPMVQKALLLILPSRRLLSVVPPENSHLISRNMPDLSLIRSPSQDSEEGVQRIKRKKNPRGWEVEVTDPGVAVAPLSIMDGRSLYLSW